MFSFSTVTKIGLVVNLARLAVGQTCRSFGVDFQDGGSYFQDITLTDPFTFVEEFQGCQADLAQNILVFPDGDQELCTDTPMTPDNTPQLATW